jgi:chemotaxis protein methyltransferase CheR
MFTLSIVETRNLARLVSRKYGIDLSGMAMTSLRLKISQFCKEHRLHPPDKLVTCLLDDPAIFDLFLYRICAAYPDMFRDPDVWIFLRDQILPGMVGDSKKPGILIADGESGDEIYSMAILLKECRLDHQVRLTAAVENNLVLDRIIHGSIPKGRYKYGQDNYRLFHPGSSLDKYFAWHHDGYYPRSDLRETISLSVKKANRPEISRDTRLVLYRNRLLYLNTETSHRRLSHMIEQASIGTILILGIRESPDQLGLLDRVHTLSSDLNIFTKAG